jgi:hypothetical protein
MKVRSILSLSLRAGLAVFVLFVTVSILFGQDEVEAVKAAKAAKAAKADHKERAFCSNNNWSGPGKVSFSELREVSLAAAGSLAVDGGRNGGIKVRGENRPNVLVRACVQAWGPTEDAAKASVSTIRVSTGGTVKAEGAMDEHWSVSYEVLVPHATNLRLNAHNGGIGISSVEGDIEFETVNGGVSLYNVAGGVKGRTTNGGVSVSLSGNSWRGSGLDVSTTNGGVNLMLPEGYAANIETSTVNGGFSSDIASLNVERSDRTRGAKINTPLNGGGAPLRIVTTNGGVRISSDKGVRY